MDFCMALVAFETETLSIIAFLSESIRNSYFNNQYLTSVA